MSIQETNRIFTKGWAIWPLCLYKGTQLQNPVFTGREQTTPCYWAFLNKGETRKSEDSINLSLKQQQQQHKGLLPYGILCDLPVITKGETNGGLLYVQTHPHFYHEGHIPTLWGMCKSFSYRYEGVCITLSLHGGKDSIKRFYQHYGRLPATNLHL